MRVLIAAGGTGGHIYPGLAIAQKIKKENPDAEIIFIGSMVGMEKNIIPQTGYPIEYVRVRGFERGLSLETVAAVKGIVDGLMDSRKILKRLSPDLVIGTGGFTSGPLLLLASRRKIPTMIHEQNAYPGRANRMLGKKVDRIAISFQEAACYFPDGKTFLAGNPVGSEYLDLNTADCRKSLGLLDSQKMILIMGGSQGAGSINDGALTLMKAWENRNDRVIYHLTGKQQYDEVLKAFSGLGIKSSENNHIQAYSNEVYRLLGAADLVVSRAGAMSVAEIAAAGTASVLVPYPMAAGNHQDFNARVLTDQGAGILIEDAMLTPELLWETVEELLNDETRLKKMGKISKSLRILDAGDRIYEEINKLME
ncbi:undecaprenyldiphospho-muramoylpentapeptide beta-N-acetylglucosaminyltransferase [Acetobacterium bakii]|uniref:UDP-N-acetylglucosamine--N-acetylmuramyl-(pentapeptide) pyrophosphoryl-undecaprenol N-acetylglucosamine transferase n=1 Tax=Acetobacterium bakii TaxID=52689 RepID=A0A0L6U414_9FIRM|nr:undecaprenyldiphospho-muramoylpentapeptide beta-N-acetylglucosaminyltransferase [Acetobacterium bakii]KNZ43264.1 UDP-diphospho-muramoylpentapeptide beta-N-acetylglucosaminyltransferase [Acetobacterium bakii]